MRTAEEIVDGLGVTPTLRADAIVTVQSIIDEVAARGMTLAADTLVVHYRKKYPAFVQNQELAQVDAILTARDNKIWRKEQKHLHDERSRARSSETRPEKPQRITVDMTTQQLIEQLKTEGGAIIASGDCTITEIAAAQASGRFSVDEHGFGYVRHPAIWLTINKSRELAHPQHQRRD